MSTASLVQRQLRSLKKVEKAQVLSGFFKTGKGQYGEGDVFLGVTVPQSRAVAKSFQDLSLAEVKKLLDSKTHEERLVALLILVAQFLGGDTKTKKKIVHFYLKNTGQINNWDLVDLSADKILGNHLFEKEKHILFRLVQSKNMWERRIAIVATFAFIKRGRFEETLALSEMVLKDTHDLIHKAVGWMLREVGKRDLGTLEKFLQKFCKEMPRTCLRYAIEKFPEEKRQRYLKGSVK